MQTFPSATAGELRGPECTDASGPEMAGAAYAFRHSLLAIGGVQAQDDLIGVLPGEDVEPVPHQGGRCITCADGDLPLLRQGLGPLLGCGESGHLPVPIGPSPLGPVLGQDLACTDQNHPTQHRCDGSSRVLHGKLLSYTFKSVRVERRYPLLVLAWDGYDIVLGGHNRTLFEVLRRG